MSPTPAPRAPATPEPTAAPFPGRLASAAAAAAATGLDALLLTPGADLRYLTGYDALPLERLTCLCVPASGDPVLVVPRLELPAAQASGAGGHVELVTHEETDDAVAIMLGLVRDRLGRDPDSLAVADRMWAQQVLRVRDAAPQARLSLAGEVVRPQRARKSEAEVAALRGAGAAIDRVHDRMGEWLRPGRTERDVGRDIADAILAEGHERVNFVIVGSGPHGASPHHGLSDRLIEASDTVVVDIGGTMPDGYCSDCTRTYAMGAVDPRAAEQYAVLLAAQRAACEAVRPGVSAEQVDAAARDVIEAAGFGELFVHRTGHGIGLEEHEDPYVVSGNSEVLEPGMCFSIEPGIYDPGRHGARIEDIVVVTATGGERLDLVTRELVRPGG